jgi:hypothetical protein
MCYVFNTAVSKSTIILNGSLLWEKEGVLFMLKTLLHAEIISNINHIEYQSSDILWWKLYVSSIIM